MANAETKLPNVPLANTRNQHIITISRALLLALVHVLDIEPSPLPEHAFGTVLLHYLSAWFVIGHLLPETEKVFNCSRHQRLAIVAYIRCV